MFTGAHSSVQLGSLYGSTEMLLRFWGSKDLTNNQITGANYRALQCLLGLTRLELKRAPILFLVLKRFIDLTFWILKIDSKRPHNILTLNKIRCYYNVRRGLLSNANWCSQGLNRDVIGSNLLIITESN